jgi:hypothetical protein
MNSTDEQIAALKANAEALKAPLRDKYNNELKGQIEALRKPERDLQAQRDAQIDNLTQAQDRVLCQKIKDARTAAEDAGVLELEAEAKKILAALKDEDGKIRLNPAA